MVDASRNHSPRTVIHAIFANLLPKKTTHSYGFQYLIYTLYNVVPHRSVCWLKNHEVCCVKH